MTTYQGSRAFAFTPDNARGTKTFLEGIFIEEIRIIRYVPGKYFELEANWIPNAGGHQHLINCFLSQERVALSINLPAGYGSLGSDVVVRDLNVDMRRNDVAIIYAKLAIFDPADDSQVEAIERWNDLLWEESEIGQMIKRYFAEERAKEQTWSGYIRPAGGGFVEAVPE